MTTALLLCFLIVDCKYKLSRSTVKAEKGSDRYIFVGRKNDYLIEEKHLSECLTVIHTAYESVCKYHNVGYKHGKWHDVTWLEKPLKEYNDPEVI